MKWVRSSPPIPVHPRKTSLCPASTSGMYSKARRLGKRRWGCRNPTLLHTLLMMPWVAWTCTCACLVTCSWSTCWSRVTPDRARGRCDQGARVNHDVLDERLLAKGGWAPLGPLSPYSEGVAFHFLLLPSSSSLVLYQRLFLILLLLWYSLPVIYFPTSRACVPVCLFIWLFCRSVRIYAFMTERNF